MHVYYCYQVRKLIEAKKVSNSLVDSTKPITKYASVKNVTLMNWHWLDELYNLKDPEIDNLSIKDVCNQLIQSYVFVAEQPSLQLKSSEYSSVRIDLGAPIFTFLPYMIGSPA